MKNGASLFGLKSNAFALLEVVIASVIMMVVILGTMSMITFMNQSLRNTNATLDFMSIANDISLSTLYPSTCTQALLNQPFTVGGSAEVIYASPSGSISVGSNNGRLYIQELNLIDQGLVPGTIDTYSARLSLLVEKTGEAMGARYLNRTFPLRVVVSAGHVVSCYSLSDLSLAKICISFQGTFNPVTQTCSGVP